MKRLYTVLIFSGLIFTSVLAGWWLNELNLHRISRYLGVPGAMFIIASLIYSLSKRDLISPGRSRPTLRLHQLFGGLGGMVLLAHGGFYFNALLPSVAFFVLLVVLVSGLIVRLILTGIKSEMKDAGAALVSQGLNPEQAAREIHLKALEDPRVLKWRRVHTPASAVLLALALLHIITIFALWGWN